MTTLDGRPRTTAPARAVTWLSLGSGATDVVLVALTLVLAALLRGRLGVFDAPADLTGDLRVAGPCILVIWVATIALAGACRTDVFGSGTEEYRRVVQASLLTAGLVGVGSYLARYPLSRGFFVLVFAVGVPLLLLGRFLVRRGVHQARRRGALLQRALVVGSVTHVAEVTAVLHRDQSLGYEVLGALTPPHDLTEETATGVPVLGNADDVVAVAHQVDADVILFAGGGLASSQQLRDIVWELEHDHFRVVVAPGVSEISSARVTVRPVGGMPLVHIEKPTWARAARAGKRVFDVVGAAGILLLASPLLVAGSLLVRLHDRGPVLFRQPRVGRDGVEFDCLKLRTMVVDAEARLAEVQSASGFSGGLYKDRADPRVTRPGRWLRRFSLDELPQLLNVVRGEMSLVGPRPPLPSEVRAYEQRTTRRLRVRPGITGLWQVSGRSELTYDEAVRLDLYYVDNWSMLQDLSILVRTVGAVLSSRGAW